MYTGPVSVMQTKDLILKDLAPPLVGYWASVCDADPISNQRWANACLTGPRTWNHLLLSPFNPQSPVTIDKQRVMRLTEKRVRGDDAGEKRKGLAKNAGQRKTEASVYRKSRLLSAPPHPSSRSACAVPASSGVSRVWRRRRWHDAGTPCHGITCWHGH